MGATQGKSKQQQKEEARIWAHAKDIEITTLYEENKIIVNEMRILESDFKTMKRMIEEELAEYHLLQSRSIEDIIQQRAETEAVKQELETLKQNLFEDAGEYDGADPMKKPTSPGDTFTWRVANRFKPTQ